MNKYLYLHVCGESSDYLAVFDGLKEGENNQMFNHFSIIAFGIII